MAKVSYGGINGAQMVNPIKTLSIKAQVFSHSSGLWELQACNSNSSGLHQKVTQKLPVAKPDDLSSTPRTHTVEEKNGLPLPSTLALWHEHTHLHTDTYTTTHVHMYTQVNKC